MDCIDFKQAKGGKITPLSLGMEMGHLGKINEAVL